MLPVTAAHTSAAHQRTIAILMSGFVKPNSINKLIRTQLQTGQRPNDPVNDRNDPSAFNMLLIWR
jgi:hypothetical protein